MAFNVPINTIAPMETPSDWVRPTDWITITDTVGEVQFLVADIGEKCFSIQTTFTRTTGNIYIDWGDGVTDTISTIASTITSHIYSTGGTPCSRGYNTFKIRVYGDATTNITSCYHKAPIFVNSSPFYNIGLLEAYHGDSCCNTTSAFPSYTYSSNGGVGSTASFTYLEYFKFPSSVSYSEATYLLSNCISLYKVVMPTSMPNLVSFSSVFFGCINLRECIFPSDASSINGDFSSVFRGCTNLKNVILPPTLDLITSISSTFQNCASLKNMVIPSTNKCNNFNFTFSGCQSLQWAKITSFPNVGNVINMTQSFINCYNLQNIYLPAFCLSTTIAVNTSSFSGCSNLKNINFPLNFNSSSMATAFQNCYKLTDVVFNSPMPNLVNFATTFSGCTNLKTIKLPTTVGATIAMGSMFNACISLESITIPSSWNITTIDNAFSTCSNIKTIILPDNAQNSITAMSGVFQNCFKLENLTLPISLNIVTGLGSAFLNCYNLKSVVLPTTMNSCTTMSSSFSGCNSLQSITLPASMNTCANFSSAFTNCYSLKEVILPSTISATNTTYSLTFSGCSSLQSITFPTTQNTSLNTLTNIFSNCSSLKTLVNLDKLGSLTATPLVGGVLGLYITLLPSISFNCPFSRFSISGLASVKNKITSVRLLNASAGQYTGVSPHVDVTYCDLEVTALDQLFTDLPTVVGKTINITGCTGAAGCTRSIATAKGWTVTG